MELPAITFSLITARDIIKNKSRRYSKEVHLRAAVEWLSKAHDKGNREGVSYGYSVLGGWRQPYRETTGYIITTFINLASFLKQQEYLDRALEMSDWELKVQNDDGSISNPHFYPDHGIVFDTGQVLFGLLRAYDISKEQKYLDAAIRAGHWLVEVSDESSLWTKCTHNGIPHVYNSRVAWALHRLNLYTENPRITEVANANLDFAVSQLKNGWFDQCAFETGAAPFTHTIAYAIRGLYESSLITNNNLYSNAAEEVAKSCIEKMHGSGFIPGQIDIQGRGRGRYCCLTGNCQLSIIWAKMFKSSGDEIYKKAALQSLEYVIRTQNTQSRNRNIKGAIKGSDPVWGPYSRFTYPNWATKFFTDAIIESWEWL